VANQEKYGGFAGNYVDQNGNNSSSSNFTNTNSSGNQIFTNGVGLPSGAHEGDTGCTVGAADPYCRAAGVGGVDQPHYSTCANGGGGADCTVGTNNASTSNNSTSSSTPTDTPIQTTVENTPTPTETPIMTDTPVITDTPTETPAITLAPTVTPLISSTPTNTPPPGATNTPGPGPSANANSGPLRDQEL